MPRHENLGAFLRVHGLRREELAQLAPASRSAVALGLLATMSAPSIVPGVPHA